MVDLTDIEQVKEIKGALHASFDGPQGKATMKFMQEVGGWFPTVHDSMETNAIIARDANRRLLGTIRTMLDLNAEQIVAVAKQGA